MEASKKGNGADLIDMHGIHSKKDSKYKKPIICAAIFLLTTVIYICEKHPDQLPDGAFVKYETLKAKLGVADSQGTLGNVYFYNPNPDYEKALFWWGMASDNGDDNSSCELASLYYEGKNVERNYEKSFTLYKKAENTCGKYGLSKFYENGIVVKRDNAKAIEILEGIKSKQSSEMQKMIDDTYLGEDLEAAIARNKLSLGVESGDSKSLYLAGKDFDDGGNKPLNYTEAVSWYKKAADKGSDEAINRLWEIYYFGLLDGVKDHKSALPYLELSAKRGYTRAQVKLARMYFDGDGVEKNYQKAADYFQAAADRGDSNSQYSLGLMLLMGDEIIPKDEKKAFTLIKEAADRGDADAQYYVFTMYRKGVGTDVDIKSAVEYLEKSAYSGVAQGQLVLGVMRAHGKDTRKDLVDGYMWLNIAADNGSPEAVSYRDRLEASMTRQDVAEAQNRQKALRVSQHDESGDSTSKTQKEPANSVQSQNSTAVKLINHSGVFAIPVMVNNVLTINFIVDSGAADVMISPDVASTLLKTGTILESDMLPDAIYTIADGSQSTSKRFKIRSMKIGSKEISDVTCAVANEKNAPMLLGQSALQKMGSYKIDYDKGLIKFD